MMIKPGTLVQSLAGRDKGRYAIVVDLPEDNFALIADGKLRKVDAPKKKKLKHLKAVYLSDAIEIKKDQKLTNKIIRELIRSFELSDKPSD